MKLNWVQMYSNTFIYSFIPQDQLDDAKRPGEEQKEEDCDCKEEEKGVNMTDDFDSHLQDVKKGNFFHHLTT